MCRKVSLLSITSGKWAGVRTEGGGACAGWGPHTPARASPVQGELGAGGAQVVCSGVSNISMRKVSMGVSPMSLKKKRCSRHLRPMERRAGRRSSSFANLRTEPRERPPPSPRTRLTAPDPEAATAGDLPELHYYAKAFHCLDHNIL